MLALDTAMDWLRDGEPERPTRYDRLVDPMTGLIRWVRPQPLIDGLPLGIHSVTVRGSDMSRIGLWTADPVGGGDGLDPEACRQAAIAEYLERYCGNFIAEDLRRAGYDELRAEGVRAIDPRTLALYSERQYDLPGFPFRRFTTDLPVRWTTGVSLTTGEPTLIPASLVWVNYIQGRYANEPPTNFHMFSGLAAGATLDDALRSGLCELIERDATMMWWLGDYPAARIDPAEDPFLAAVMAPTRGDVRWHLVSIPSAFGVPVAGALLVDERDGIAGMGFACRPTFRDAAVKACAEAIQLHRLAWAIKDPDGKVWRAMRQGVVHGGTLKPFRPDHGYLDAFRPDFHDLTDLAHHSQIYLDRRLWRELERVSGTPLASLGTVPPVADNTCEGYVARLARAGIEAYAVDLTTPDVREEGLWVVRVVAPGLLPNGPAGFPFIGGDRLYDVPVARGWRSQRATEERLNYAPLPHS
jgi:ribosomal protein S12 methylthiotransferase accessory factor